MNVIVCYKFLTITLKKWYILRKRRTGDYGAWRL